MGARPARYLPTTAEAGRSRVWCGGLCMTGPDYRGTILTIIIMTAIFVGECAVSFPYLLRNEPMVGIPLLCVMLVSFVITAVAAYLASTTDPGIIPRSPVLPASIIAFPTIRERVVSLQGRPLTLKFCDTCRIWRPPRSSHCATCNNCVRRFDHHCPWIGNDVGLRNYRSYFTFVVFASISAMVAIATSALTLYFTADAKESFGKALRHKGTAVNLVLVALCLLALMFTGGLSGFHVYLMSNNITTAESFKKRARNSSSQLDDLRGCASICLLQCTGRQDSAVTQGYDGPSYPEELELLGLVDAQVAEEQAAQGLVIAPPRVVSMGSPYHGHNRAAGVGAGGSNCV